MDASYPHLTAYLAAHPATAHPPSEVAAQLEPILEQVLKRLETTIRGERKLTADRLGNTLPHLVANAFEVNLIAFATAHALIAQLAPGLTYTDFRPSFGMMEKLTEAQVRQLGALKAALDAREPGQWLPNRPDVTTLISRAEALGLADPVFLRGLRAAFPNADALWNGLAKV